MPFLSISVGTQRDMRGPMPMNGMGVSGMSVTRGGGGGASPRICTRLPPPVEMGRRPLRGTGGGGATTTGPDATQPPAICQNLRGSWGDSHTRTGPGRPPPWGGGGGGHWRGGSGRGELGGGASGRSVGGGGGGVPGGAIWGGIGGGGHRLQLPPLALPLG